MDPLQLVNYNNELSAAQAQRQMDFQREMSNTAHQREVADLKAAGLNPVLSAKLGGASTPSGAMGDIDTSGTSEIIRQMLAISGSAAGAARAAAESTEDLIKDKESWNSGVSTIANLGGLVPGVGKWLRAAAKIFKADTINSAWRNLSSAENAEKAKKALEDIDWSGA